MLKGFVKTTNEKRPPKEPFSFLPSAGASLVTPTGIEPVFQP